MVLGAARGVNMQGAVVAEAERAARFHGFYKFVTNGKRVRITVV